MKFTIDLRVPSVVHSLLGQIKISHIILFSAIIRMFCAAFPSDGSSIFDEVHYLGAVRAMMQGLPANAEHPPLTKIIVMWSIQIFGDHWFAWRLPIILYSLGATYLVYRIAKEFLDEKKALLVSVFMIFDIVFFIQGNIYVLEVPGLMFGLAFVLYYLKGRYWFSAAMIGLGFLCSEKALFLLLGAAVYHVMLNWRRPTKPVVKKVGLFLTLCVIVGAGGLALSDSVWPPSKSTHININIANTIYQDENGNPVRTETATKTQTTYEYMLNPIDHVLWMMSYYSGINSHLETPPENFRPPWTWILPIGNWNNPPVYLSTVIRTPTGEYYPVNYRSQTPIFIWFMTVPILGLCLWMFKERESKFILAMIAGTFGPWLAWEPFKMNMPFNHYMIFTIPFVCFGIPWFWGKVAPKYWKPITAIHLTLVILYFFAFFPIGLVRTI